MLEEASSLIRKILDGNTTKLQKIFFFREWGDLLKTAYVETLEPYHRWLGVQLCNILSRTIPNKDVMIYYLANGNHNCEQVVLRDLQKYNKHLKECVQRLFSFLTRNNMFEI